MNEWNHIYLADKDIYPAAVQMFVSWTRFRILGEIELKLRMKKCVSRSVFYCIVITKNKLFI